MDIHEHMLHNAILHLCLSAVYIMSTVFVSAIKLDVTSFSFPDTFMLVRGYFDQSPFDLKVTNIDSVLDIPPSYEDKTNYNITVFFSNKDARTDATFTVLDEVFATEVPQSTLQEELFRGLTLTMSGNVTIRLTRASCTSAAFVCARLDPALGARYGRAVGSTHISCAVPFKNCDGEFV
jgi:hypothetical protein